MLTSIKELHINDEFLTCFFPKLVSQLNLAVFLSSIRRVQHPENVRNLRMLYVRRMYTGAETRARRKLRGLRLLEGGGVALVRSFLRDVTHAHAADLWSLILALLLLFCISCVVVRVYTTPKVPPQLQTHARLWQSNKHFISAWLAGFYLSSPR